MLTRILYWSFAGLFVSVWRRCGVPVSLRLLHPRATLLRVPVDQRDIWTSPGEDADGCDRYHGLLAGASSSFAAHRDHWGVRFAGSWPSPGSRMSLPRPASECHVSECWNVHRDVDGLATLCPSRSQTPNDVSVPSQSNQPLQRFPHSVHVYGDILHVRRNACGVL